MDGFEDVIDMGSLSIHNSKARQPKPVDARETVENLLRIWTGNMVGVPPGASPGVIEIANTFPTKTESEEMIERQTLYAEFLFTEGERLDREKNWKEITGAMKIMAKWLGKQTLWSEPGRVSDMVPCPACGGQILPRIPKCIHCGTQLRPFPKDLAALNNQAFQPVADEPVAAQEA
jgi:hypothetical protein